MQHLVTEIFAPHGNVVEAGLACGVIEMVPLGVEPGNVVDDGEEPGWCRVCLRTAQGREEEAGIHGDLGSIEDDGELGELEEDSDVLSTEEEMPMNGQDEPPG